MSTDASAAPKSKITHDYNVKAQQDHVDIPKAAEDEIAADGNGV